MLVLHYTGMETTLQAAERLSDPFSKVSAHYLVHQDGDLYRMVDSLKRAWHAGVSHWRGKDSVNAYSIGIEISNPGHEFGYQPFPEKQMETVKEVCQGLVKKFEIPHQNIVAHSDVAPDRKEDPGEFFDWKMLAEAGVGYWPEAKSSKAEPLFKEGDISEEVEHLQRDLQIYGYGMEVDGEFGPHTAEVVKAFQRHFDARPEQAKTLPAGSEGAEWIDGVWNTVLQEKLEILLSKIKK